MNDVLSNEGLQVDLAALESADLDEAEFLEQLTELMAESAGASAAWLLSVGNSGAEVLTENDEEADDYAALATRHEKFAEHCNLAGIHRKPAVLKLEATPFTNPEDHDPLIDSAGAVFFVPLESSIGIGLVACVYCESDVITDLIAHIQELMVLAQASERRIASRHATPTTAKIEVTATEVAETEVAKSEEAKTEGSGAEPVEGSSDQTQTDANEQAADDLVQQISHLTTELAQAHARQSQLKSMVTLGEAASASLDKKKTAFVLANLLQSCIEVDRISVLEVNGKQARMLAISGQATFDRRSNAVRAAQQLTKVALKSGDPLWFEGDQEALAPPVQKVVARYVDESLVQGFALLPIYESRPPYYRSDEQSLVEFVNPGRTDKRVLRGAVLLESIEQPLDREEVEVSWAEAQPQVANHFSNAKRHSDLFLLPLLLMLTKFAALFRGHTARKAWGLTLGVAALLTAGFLIPADFRVRCEGHLQPDKMHHVFVKRDGVVMDVLVKEGELVDEGAPLATLQNRDLEFEIAELRGELDEKQRALQHLVYRRLDHANNVAAQQSSESYHELAEQSELVQSQIASLEKTLAVKLQQQSDLTIRAPFEGLVMGWNVDRRYLNRPLDQGTRLFSLAKSEGRRVLELKVPDQRSGYISTAWRERRSDQEPLTVEFSIASLPDRRFEAEVSHVNPGLERDSDLGYVMPLEANPRGELPKDLRAGIPVVAKVVCGRRSFIYCKSYEFLDWVQRTAFEYLL